MVSPSTEATALSKTQKTFYLHDNLIRLLDFLQSRTGASFTRQVTAAVIQYLFSRPDGPDPLVMEASVKLENAELSFDDLPAWLAGQWGIIAMMQASEANRASPGSTEQVARTRDMHRHQANAHGWRNVVRLGPGLVDGLVRLWALTDSGFDLERILETVSIDELRQCPAFLGKPGEGELTPIPGGPGPADPTPSDTTPKSHKTQ